MKKIISIILALALVVVSCFAMTSCQLLDMFKPSSSSEEETPQTPKKVQIGVQAGTTGEYFVNGDVDWDFEGIAGYEAKGYQNPGLAVNDMLNGNVKYVVVDHGFGLKSWYCNISGTTCSVGDEVQKGDTIAKTGASNFYGQPGFYLITTVLDTPVSPYAIYENNFALPY